MIDVTGLDWVSSALSLWGIWTVGNKKAYGFIIFTVSGLGWIIYVACTGYAAGVLLTVIPSMVLNVRNYLKWTRKGAEDG